MKSNEDKNLNFQYFGMKHFLMFKTSLLLLNFCLCVYVQFDGMVYQQIVGIPMGTNCASLNSRYILILLREGLMSDLQKSKRFDLIDMFNDTSRYLDDIFTIDNPEFEKHISDIQLNFS